MTATLTIRDETTSGDAVNEFELDLSELATERVAVRELIRSRVYQEVKDYNLKQTGLFRGLVQPTETERTLNGFKLGRSRRIDWREQYEKAVEAFRRNGFLILVGDRQVTDPDEAIEPAPGASATFLKLVPLVGG